LRPVHGIPLDAIASGQRGAVSAIERKGLRGTRELFGVRSQGYRAASADEIAI